MSRKDFFNTINMLYQAVRRSVGNSFGEVQLTGMSIYLNPNGTYFLNDTTGG